SRRPPLSAYTTLFRSHPGIAGELVDVPADGHGHALVGQDREDPEAHQQPEIAVAQRRRAAVPGAPGCARAHARARCAASRMKASSEARPLLRVGERCLARPISTM